MKIQNWKTQIEPSLLVDSEAVDKYREFVRDFMHKSQNALSQPVFGVSTETATESKPLTVDEINSAMGIVNLKK